MNPIDELRQESLGINEFEEILGSGKRDVDKFFDIFLSITSCIRDSVFLKGNVLLNKILPDLARSTKDLDMAILNSEIFNDCIRPKLVEIGDTYISLGLADRYEIKDMGDTNIGVFTVFSKNDVKFNIDIGNTKHLYCGIVKYTFSGNEILGSSVEKIVCDKLKAILTTRRLKRKKDLYDIFIIHESGLWPSMDDVYTLMIESSPDGIVNSLLSNFPFSEKELADLKGSWGSMQIFSSMGAPIKRPSFESIYSILSDSYYQLKIIHSK